MAELYWFPIYVDKWLSSPAIMLMTPAEEGAFFRLLLLAWGNGQNPPSLPTDPLWLGKNSRLDKRWSRSATKLLAQFTEKDGRLYNKMLTKVWERQRVSHDSAVDRGKKGAAKRHGKKGSSAIAQLDPKGKLSSSSANGAGIAQLKHIELELEKELEPGPKGPRVLASFAAGAVPAPKAPDARRQPPEPIPGEPPPKYDVDALHAEYLVALNAHVNKWIRDNPDAWEAVDVEARQFIRAPLGSPLGKLLSASHRERVLVIVQRRTEYVDADTYVRRRVAEIEAA